MLITMDCHSFSKMLLAAVIVEEAQPLLCFDGRSIMARPGSLCKNFLACEQALIDMG